MKGRGRIGGPFVWQSLYALDVIEERFEGRALTTALAIYVGLTRLANERAEGGTSFKAEQREVAARSGVSERTVREYAPRLEAAGVVDLERHDGAAHGWNLREPEPRQELPTPPAGAAGVPRQEIPGTPAAAAGVHIQEEEGKKTTTSSSTADIPDALVEDAGALLRQKRRVDGKVVTEEEMAVAAHALDEFNAQSGSEFGLGAHLTALVMRIRERPSMDAEKHRRLVQSAWRLRWWERQGGKRRRPTPAVIYGHSGVFENVVQDAVDEAKGREPQVDRRGRYERTRDVEAD